MSTGKNDSLGYDGDSNQRLDTARIVPVPLHLGLSERIETFRSPAGD